MKGNIKTIMNFVLYVLTIIVVVKETFRYPNVSFYNHLCRHSLFQNIIVKSGIKSAEGSSIISQNCMAGVVFGRILPSSVLLVLFGRD